VPFKSQAQRRKFAELLVKGEISPETFEEWNRETGSAKIHEYAKSVAKRGSRGKTKSKARTGAKPASKPKAKSRIRSKSKSSSKSKRKLL
jgi:hypothetical protein